LEALEDRCVPSTLKVTNNLDSGAGSLRYEIAQAQSNDTVLFDFGNKQANSTPHTITLTSGELSINKNLTIQGPGAGLLTVQSTGRGNFNASRIFEVSSGTVTLSGMTISNGDGVHVYRSDPAFDPYSYEGYGGAVLNTPSGNLTISDCILSRNVGSAGGGAIANFGMLTVSGCTVSNNTTYANGGGIYNVGTLTVSGSTLSGNTASSTGVNYGGGIYTSGNTTVTMSGCTLSGNSSSYGGAIANGGTAPLMVTGCTLTSNSANLGGGGIWSAGTVTLSNCVFSGNSPDNIEGNVIDGGGNIFK
jgi:hypothetical protein